MKFSLLIVVGMLLTFSAFAEEFSDTVISPGGEITVRCESNSRPKETKKCSISPGLNGQPNFITLNGNTISVLPMDFNTAVDQIRVFVRNGLCESTIWK